MKKIFFTLFYCFLFSASFGVTTTNELWKQFHSNHGHEVPVMALLLEQYASANNWKARDSAMEIFLQSMQFEDRREDVNQIHTLYFKSDQFSSVETATGIADEWIHSLKEWNHPDWICRAYIARFHVFETFRNYAQACEFIQSIGYYANLSGSGDLLFEFRRINGICSEQGKQMNQALQNYLDALYLGKRNMKAEQELQALEQIARFYANIKRFDRASSYKLRQIRLFLQEHPQPDSVVYIRMISELSDYYFDNRELSKAIPFHKQVLQFAFHHQLQTVINNQFAIYRSYLTEVNDMDALYRLYHQEYPGELLRLAAEDSIKFLRIQALLYEHDHLTDSARQCFQKAFLLLNQSHYGVTEKANFYRRYGEFCTRNQINEKAVQCFDSFLLYSQRANYFPFIHDASAYLHQIYASLHQYEKAYAYQSLTLRYQDSMNATERNEEYLKMEMENAEMQHQLEQEELEKNEKKKHYLQYVFIVIISTISLISLLLVSSLHIPRILIRIFGFLTFILIFEFIILLIDHKIHVLTHGEPIKILGIKILVIALILPLHHWVEEKVVHYLIHHKIIDFQKLNSWFQRRGEEVKQWWQRWLHRMNHE